MSFRPRREHELDPLSDDELITYIVGARDSGHRDEGRAALGVLAFRRLGDVERRVRIKIPKADVQDVAMEVMTSAIRTAFDGQSVGQFVSLLHTITDRRIADYHRRPRLDTQPLPEENQESDDIWGEGAVDDDFTSEVDLRSVINQAMDELSDAHRMVVDLYVFRKETAKETAEEVNMALGDDLDPEMTESNVHQIAKRFRVRLKELLEDARGGE